MNGGPPGGGDADRFLADLRADEAAHARRRERWLRRSLAEEASLAGILDGARGRTVTLELRGGDRVTGEIVGTGDDAVLVLRADGRSVWITRRSVAVVEAAGPLPGQAPADEARRLVEVLADLAQEGTRVQVRLDGGGEVAGEVVAVGEVLTLRDGPAGTMRYVPLDAVVWVLPSS